MELEQQKYPQKMQPMASHITEVQMSGWWLEPDVTEEDVVFKVHYHIEDRSYDYNGPMGSKTHHDWAITIQTILSATGTRSYVDYSDRVTHSPAFIEQLTDVLYECIEV